MAKLGDNPRLCRDAVDVVEAVATIVSLLALAQPSVEVEPVHRRAATLLLRLSRLRLRFADCLRCGEDVSGELLGVSHGHRPDDRDRLPWTVRVRVEVDGELRSVEPGHKQRLSVKNRLDHRCTLPVAAPSITSADVTRREISVPSSSWTS